ncbi:MAG: hypothetical protein Ct9H300mP12_09540 [Acidimicrobiales bacterium]|nr:MAG: hypothetical protein Ct9H300mP12_09540 [Acidimicrobiales bacterium]
MGRDGHLRHALVQELGPRVFQLGHQAFRVGQSGRIDAFSAGLGGDYARNPYRLQATGRGARADWSLPISARTTRRWTSGPSRSTRP